MAKFKIRLEFVLEADDKPTARKLFHELRGTDNREDVYFDTEHIWEMSGSEPTGWGSLVKKQVLGDSKPKRY